MSRSEPELQPRDITTALSTLLAAYYGARQLVRDFDRFPHSITAEERTRIEEGTARLERTLEPIVQRIGATALSPASAESLAAVARAAGPDDTSWRRFMAHVDQLRDTTGKASRNLRLRKGTGEFVVGQAADGKGTAPATDRNVQLSLKRLNRKLLALEMLAGVEKPDSRPLRILVDVTNKCNFRCRTCYQSNSQDFVYYDLTRAPFENLRPFLEAAEVVNFAGTGEPLLSADTPELIRLAAASGVQTELVTNGSLFHRLKGLEEHVSRVFLSFDGASSKTVDTIRKGARFEHIVADLRAMPTVLRRKICFNMVVCRVNVHEIAALAKLSRELGVGALHLQAFHPYLPWHDAMALREEDLGLLAEQVAAAGRELEGTGMTFNVTFPVNSVPDRAAPPRSAPVPEQEQILAQLNRVPTPSPQDQETWDSMSRRFAELASMELPGGLSSAVAGSPTSPVPEDAVDPVAHLERRIREVLSHMKTLPRFTVPSCLAPHSLLYLVGDGTTRPCCILETRIGDLHADSARDVWHSSGSVALRRSAARDSGLPSSCDGCTDGGRFGFLHELLLEAQGLGVDMTKVVLPPDAPVPKAIVRWLDDVRKRASADWGCAQGYLDTVEGRWIAGWALHPDIDGPQVVEIFVDGNLVLSTASDGFREDLRLAGIGDGNHGFSVYVPEHYVDGLVHEIQVRFARTGTHLSGSPRLAVLAR